MLCNGAVVATIGQQRRRRPAPVRIGEQAWTYVYRSGQLLGHLVDEPAGEPRCWARVASHRSPWEIVVDGQPFTRRWVDPRTAHYDWPSGEVAVEVRGEGVLGNRYASPADPRLALHQHVFLLWLDVCIRWDV
ncbi:hypothetical protein ACI8AF_02575 [Blastococcus sp. SYSU D00669]